MVLDSTLNRNVSPPFGSNHQISIAPARPRRMIPSTPRGRTTVPVRSWLPGCLRGNPPWHRRPRRRRRCSARGEEGPHAVLVRREPVQRPERLKGEILEVDMIPSSIPGMELHKRTYLRWLPAIRSVTGPPAVLHVSLVVSTVHESSAGSDGVGSSYSGGPSSSAAGSSPHAGTRSAPGSTASPGARPGA